MLKRESAFTFVFAVAGLATSLAAAGEGHQQIASPAISRSASPAATCPPIASIVALLRRASFSLEQGKDAAVIESLHDSPVVSCYAQASLLLAAAYEESGNLSQAEETLRQAHLQWPANTSIAVSLAREYLSQGRKQDAASALVNVHVKESTPWQEIQLSVIVLLANQQLPAAEKFARLGFKTYPSLDSLLLLANTLQLEGRYKDVIALLDSKRDAYSNSSKFLVTLAESEYDASSYDPARSHLSRAILLDPSLYQAHYLLGNILLKQGDADAAKAEYETALQLSADQPRTYYHLALALRAMHQEEQEEGVLSKALALDPDYALAHCELGRLLLNRGRTADAVTQLELAATGNKFLEEAYSLLSRAYERLGDTVKAEEMAQKLSAVRSANHQGVPVQDASGGGDLSAP